MLGILRDACRWRLGRPRTPIPRARRAASTFGRPDRSPRSSAPEHAAAAAEWFGVTAGGNFERRPQRAAPPGARALGRSAEGEEGGAALERARSARVRPAGRQGADRVERDVRLLGAGRGRGGDGERDLAAARRSRSASSSGLTATPPTGGGCGPGSAGRRRRTSPRRRLRLAGRLPDRDSASSTGLRRYTEEALTAAHELIRLFSAEDGGWYTTGADAEALVVRPRQDHDGVTPAAGSVAALGARPARRDQRRRALPDPGQPERRGGRHGARPIAAVVRAPRRGGGLPRDRRGRGRRRRRPRRPRRRGIGGLRARTGAGLGRIAAEPAGRGAARPRAPTFAGAGCVSCRSPIPRRFPPPSTTRATDARTMIST